jgi:hypothetical protein
MRFLLLFLCLLTLAGPASTDEALKTFEPDDHTFSVSLPGRARVVSAEENRFLWGIDDGSRSFLFGYSLLPRAEGLEEKSLRAGLQQFLTSYLASAKIQEKGRTPITYLGHPGIDGQGSASYGASWIRVVAVGPRIYVLTSDGTTQETHQAFADSLKLNP